MARPYVFPDPKDRSPNNSHISLDRNTVLSLYNQETSMAAERVTEAIKSWFNDKATELGWSEVRFSTDSTAILTAKVVLQK